MHTTTTRLPQRLRGAVVAALLVTGAPPASAQPIEAGSQDALELPNARQYGTPAPRPSAVSAGRGQYRGDSGLGAVSPDLPASLPPPRGPGFQVPYGGYGENGYGGPVDGDSRSGYAGRDGYGNAGGYGGAGGYSGNNYGSNSYGSSYGGGNAQYSNGNPYGAGNAFNGGGGEFGPGSPAFVAPFGGGPGNQTPIPLGAGSLYSGSAVNGTAVGPQFSSQLPAYQARSRR